MDRYELLIEAEALASLEPAAVAIVDCRFNLLDPGEGPRLYREGHIPGAVYADLDRDLAGPVQPDSGRHPLPDVDEFCDRLECWGIGNDTQVVVYDDRSGALAARLWWLLRWLGHSRVAVLDGGFAAWTAAGLPTETAVPSPPRARFRPAIRNELVMTTRQLCKAMSSGTPMRLVDARDERRFRGEVEPIDAVAGHVPGALNLPFSRNLEADGRWRSPDALAAEWARLPDSGETVAMCGSGVTACHLVLSALRAGLPEPRLYVGSYSEWIRDPARPVAAGEG